MEKKIRSKYDISIPNKCLGHILCNVKCPIFSFTCIFHAPIKTAVYAWDNLKSPEENNLVPQSEGGAKIFVKASNIYESKSWFNKMVARDSQLSDSGKPTPE